MEKRILGNSDLAITRLGFGAWAIGGADWKFGWGPQDDAESIATIRGALDGGINWIDTAAAYGLGHSEEVVARALAGIRATLPPAGRDDRPLSGALANGPLHRENATRGGHVVSERRRWILHGSYAQAGRLEAADNFRPARPIGVSTVN